MTGGLVDWWFGGLVAGWFLSTFCLVLGKIQMKIPTNCILSTENPTDSGQVVSFSETQFCPQPWGESP